MADWRRARARERRRTGDAGTSVLEFVVVVPAVLLLLFALIQAGLWFHAREVATRAAQQGVDAARSYDAAPGDGTAAAHRFLRAIGGSLDGPQVTVDRTAGQVSVEVRGHVVTLVPGWKIEVDQRVQAPTEGWTP